MSARNNHFQLSRSRFFSGRLRSGFSRVRYAKSRQSGGERSAHSTRAGQNFTPRK
jgi:hypothetical protein